MTLVKNDCVEEHESVSLRNKEHGPRSRFKSINMFDTKIKRESLNFLNDKELLQAIHGEAKIYHKQRLRNLKSA